MVFGRKHKNPIKIADKGVVEWKYTTCGYCSTGCSIEVGLDKRGDAVASRGVAGADVNRGKLCIKGIFEHELFKSAGRGTRPLMRASRLDAFAETGWDSALDRVGDEIKRLQASHGRDSFAIVSTGQIMTEEFYTLGKLARGAIGTNNYAATPRCAWPPPCRATSARSARTARPAATRISSTPNACWPSVPTCRSSTRSFSGG